MKEKGNIFVLPAIGWVLLFTIFPLLYSLRVALSQVVFGRITGWAGLSNFARMFGDHRFWQVLQFTLYFVVASVTITVLLGLGLALIFNRKMRGLKFFRALLTTPLFAAPVAIGYLGVMLFNERSGPINVLLRTLGLPEGAWLSNPAWARASVILVDVWQWTPFAFIIILAGLQSLSDEVYEAAAIESSSGWQIFRHVTFPLILPVVGTVTMLRIVDAFRVFDIPFVLTGGGPGVTTRTLTYYIYVQGLSNLDMGYASAMAYFLMAITLLVGIFFYRQSRALYQ
ncbi:MAG TPA: sugar ABC transporter permease [Atribacteraceae bacterium]|nr:sugar ABC transporter permease [Atribacteraceae bacterium]